MLAAGAADGDGEIALSLSDVVRNQEVDHGAELFEEGPGYLVLQNIPGHVLVGAVLVAHRRDVIGVGQKPHVEDEVRVPRDAVLETEADELEPDDVLYAGAAEAGDDLPAQFPGPEGRGIDHSARDRPDRRLCPEGTSQRCCCIASTR